jgi:4-hydroxybenzoate polyprenyltransferase
MANRWWTYQAERFPLMGHGPLIAAFSFCAVAYSSVLRGGGWPSIDSALVAFISCLIFFVQLRIADEFKDIEEDTLYRPYRPVPRGLITLRELAIVFAIGAAVQLGLALWLDWRLIIVLAVVWMYLAAMSREFFVRDYLKRRPLLYLISHMAIMPLIDFYATSSDWLVHTARIPNGLAWFLAASFFNGMVIEIGRKIRSPDDEEHGVQTYSFLWGQSVAVASWWLAAALAMLSTIAAAAQVSTAAPVAGIMLALGAILAWTGVDFLRRPTAGKGKRIEWMSGIWTIGLYLSLGLVPLFREAWQ